MTERKPVVRKLVAYNPARAALKTFEEEYGSIIVDCTTTTGMQSAKACRKEIRDTRSNLEDLRKETKAPFLAKGAQVDAEAKAIKKKLDELFTKFDSAIKQVENAEAIKAQAELETAQAKAQELNDREAAIIAKEIELGIREPDHEEAVQEPTSAGTHSDSPADMGSVSVAAEGSVICQPHIDLANNYLAALRSIRKLIEPTDPQPDSGDIDEKIAVQHDQVLAEVWDIVDEVV